jgi:hypothetical protein
MKVMSGKTGFCLRFKNDIDSGLVAHGFGSRIKADGGQNLAMKAAHFQQAVTASDRVITVGMAKPTNYMG